MLEDCLTWHRESRLEAWFSSGVMAAPTPHISQLLLADVELPRQSLAGNVRTK
jgi:hypothetical protein